MTALKRRPFHTDMFIDLSTMADGYSVTSGAAATIGSAGDDLLRGEDEDPRSVADLRFVVHSSQSNSKVVSVAKTEVVVPIERDTSATTASDCCEPPPLLSSYLHRASLTLRSFLVVVDDIGRGSNDKAAAVHTREGSVVRFPAGDCISSTHRFPPPDSSARSRLYYTGADYASFKDEYRAVLH
eukprot:CAMPEP_0113550464 /NCGR_PEP_ID=MMETSP0015_2-20120614/13995_1 /TAXON_ID=2838 /ORGANISM="Odontella" /LENGTH=183 /DNA_ID=CAMNT_0000451271 /DNA_START=585 /DNA_END=1136 /DNA_ORIENTATION=- /assembly_acc=CAM_ASM_000160